MVENELVYHRFAELTIFMFPVVSSRPTHARSWRRWERSRPLTLGKSRKLHREDESQLRETEVRTGESLEEVAFELDLDSWGA